MNEEQIRKIASETFTENIMNNLDSSIIFKYIQELEQENQELKKQLSNSRQIKNQQKEFIEYLENESKELIRDAGYHQRICLDILEKYKEIIGVKE